MSVTIKGDLSLHCLLIYLELLTLKALIMRGWSGGAMVLGKLPVPGRPTVWITVG